MKNTNQTPLLSLDIYYKIVKGDYRGTGQDFNTFDKFLNILHLMPNCPVEHSVIPFPTNVKTPLPCISHNEKHPELKQISYLRDLFQHNQLKNSLNFLKFFIDQNKKKISEQNIEKLLRVCNNFFRIPLFDLNLTTIEKKDIVQSFFDLFASISNIPEAAAISTIKKNNLEVGNLIKLSTGFLIKLSKLNSTANITSTLSNLTYPIYEPMKSYLMGLGSLALLYREDEDQANLSVFEDSASTLMNYFTPLLTNNQSNHLKYIFISQYHSANDVQEAYTKLFNSNNYQKFTAVTVTTHVIPATNQITQAVVHNNASVTEFPAYLNNTKSSQTTSNLEEISTKTFLPPAQYPSVTEMGTSFAHGFASGLMNLVTQGTSMYLRRKGHGKSSISAISLSLMSSILQASYVATFPLMLSKLNTLVTQGRNEEAQGQWEMMTSDILPTFFTSLGLNTGLQLLNYLSENYLAKQFTIKSFVQSIPVLSTFWSFTQNPILTGIQATTAYTVSAAGLFGFNRYFSTSNHSNSDAETNKSTTIKMKNLTPTSEDKELEANDNNTARKRFNYITEEKLNKIQNYSAQIKVLLEHFVNALETSIKTNDDEIINQNSSAQTMSKYCLQESIAKKKLVLNKLIQSEAYHKLSELNELLMEERHKEACKEYNDQKLFEEKMGTTANVFKLMQGFYETNSSLGNNIPLKSLLSSIQGSIQGQKTQFDSNTLTSLEKTLEETLQQLDKLLSAIRQPIGKYNTFHASFRLAEDAVKRALANEEKFYNGYFSSTQHHNKSNQANRSHSICYSERTISSGSDTSNTSGNTAYNPVDPQQKTLLLNGTSFKI